MPMPRTTRPALVISPEEYNSISSMAMFMPITSQIKGYPFEVLINNTQVQGVILCDQVRSPDWIERRARFICKISNIEMRDALEKLQVLLGLMVICIKRIFKKVVVSAGKQGRKKMIEEIEEARQWVSS